MGWLCRAKPEGVARLFKRSDLAKRKRKQGKETGGAKQDEHRAFKTLM